MDLNCPRAKSVCYQLFGDTPRSGSPRKGSGRSLVVSTEGVDSGPLDRGKASEACEIGGLGTLHASLTDGSLVRARCPEEAAAGGRLESVGD